MSNLSFEHEVRARVSDAFERRLRRAPKQLLRGLIGKTHIDRALWTFNDYAILAVDGPKELRATKQRERRFGHPFPEMISTHVDVAAPFSVPKGTRNVGFRGIALKVNPGGAGIVLGRDATAYFRNVDVIRAEALSSARSPDPGVYTVGLVYAVGFGEFISLGDFDEALDELIAFSLTRIAS